MARILLIEDDFFLRAILKHALEELGHVVIEAPNATNAESLHVEYGFDAIVTDLIMPERDGFELLMEFRQCFPSVRIIAMSAGGQISAPDYLMMASRLGAAATLTKPITDEQLGAVVSRVLSV
jgi:DNA-binding NtrC family response regulator